MNTWNYTTVSAGPAKHDELLRQLYGICVASHVTEILYTSTTVVPPENPSPVTAILFWTLYGPLFPMSHRKESIQLSNYLCTWLVSCNVMSSRLQQMTRFPSLLGPNGVLVCLSVSLGLSFTCSRLLLAVVYDVQLTRTQVALGLLISCHLVACSEWVISALVIWRALYCFL